MVGSKLVYLLNHIYFKAIDLLMINAAVHTKYKRPVYLFWNQVLTCVSDKDNALASSTLSGVER